MQTASMTIDRVAFIFENYIGHANFARLVRASARRTANLEAHYCLVDSRGVGLLDRLPVIRGNATLQASVAAWRMAASIRADVDAYFVHTQTAALFLVLIRPRRPIIISTDATPTNVAQIGGFEQVNILGLRTFKRRVTALSLNAADSIVAWTPWVARSLEEDYGVQPEKITILSPGIDVSAWRVGPGPSDGQPFRFLFVGGDFERKGGRTLVSALDALRRPWSLDIVTASDAAESMKSDQIRVHRQLEPGDQALVDLYAGAHAFVLPTSSDSYGFAILEAMASALPVVTTRVGGLAERLESSGAVLMVEPGDERGLAEAMSRLAEDHGLARAMGRRGRHLVEAEFDSMKTGGQLLRHVLEIARRARPG